MKLNEKFKNYLKLCSAGFVLIWLFIKSPFNPLYSDYSGGEMTFVTINFIYWIFVSIFVLWIIFYINRSNFDKFSTLLFALSNFLYLSFYIFYGFDVTDTGFSLSKQWSMYHGLWSENFDAIAGTNLIGGLWLSIPGEPFLLWARLGFVIVQVSIVLVSYKIMLLYFNPRKLFVVALPLSLFFSIWNYYQTINYDNLPFLLFLISIYFILKSLKIEDFKKKYLIISGSIAILAVFCKITYLVALILPIFLIILDQSLLSKKYFKDKILYYLFGVLIGTGVLTVIIFIVGGLDSYLFYFCDVINELVKVKDSSLLHKQNHSFTKLYEIYKSNILYVILDTYKFVFIILIVEYLRTKAQRVKAIKYCVILTGTFVLYYFIFEIDGNNQYTYDSIKYFLSFFFSIFILWTILSENIVIKKHILLAAASLGLFFFSFLGSDLVFRAAFHTNSEFILCTLPVILIRETKFELFKYKINFTFLFYFILVIFSLSIINKKNDLYREPNFKFITKAFEARSLSGIKSNPQRVEVVDSLITFLHDIPNIHDKKIMFTHSNVLMYYLTDINYFMISPWDILNDYYVLKQKLTSNMPDLFIIPKLSHRLRTWPIKSKPADTVDAVFQKHYDVYDSFIEKNGYKVIYKNSFYTVHSLE